jgi:hypothetical protein
MAFEVVKAMQAEGLDWGEGYRPLGRQALEAIIEGPPPPSDYRRAPSADAVDSSHCGDRQRHRHRTGRDGDRMRSKRL